MRNELLEELAADITPRIDLEHEVTVGMLVARGMTRNTAGRILREGVERGEYLCREVVYMGKIHKAYRKAG